MQKVAFQIGEKGIDYSVIQKMVLGQPTTIHLGLKYKYLTPYIETDSR